MTEIPDVILDSEDEEEDKPSFREEDMKHLEHLHREYIEMLESVYWIDRPCSDGFTHSYEIPELSGEDYDFEDFDWEPERDDFNDDEEYEDMVEYIAEKNKKQPFKTSTSLCPFLMPMGLVYKSCMRMNIVINFMFSQAFREQICYELLPEGWSQRNYAGKWTDPLKIISYEHALMMWHVVDRFMKDALEGDSPSAPSGPWNDLTVDENHPVIRDWQRCASNVDILMETHTLTYGDDDYGNYHRFSKLHDIEVHEFTKAFHEMRGDSKLNVLYAVMVKDPECEVECWQLKQYPKTPCC